MERVSEGGRERGREGGKERETDRQKLLTISFSLLNFFSTNTL